MSSVSASGESDDQTAHEVAAAKMFNAIRRFRAAFLVVERTLANITGAALERSGHADLWSDMVFTVSNTAGALRRTWNEDTTKKPGASSDPQSSYFYQTSLTIAWMSTALKDSFTTKGHSSEVAADRMKSRNPMPLDIIHEVDIGEKRPTYVYADGNGKRVRCAYLDRSPPPASPDFAFGGVAMQLKWQSPAEFYGNSIPFGAMLPVLRSLGETGILTPGKCTTYVAAIVHSWYEMVDAAYVYEGALNDFYAATDPGAPSSSSRFGFMQERIAGTDFTVLDYYTRARVEAYGRAQNYIVNLSAAEGLGGMLDGVDASELAKDPGQISSLIERTLGISGLGPDFLSRLPGFEALTKMIASSSSS